MCRWVRSARQSALYSALVTSLVTPFWACSSSQTGQDESVSTEQERELDAALTRDPGLPDAGIVTSFGEDSQNVAESTLATDVESTAAQAVSSVASVDGTIDATPTSGSTSGSGLDPSSSEGAGAAASPCGFDALRLTRRDIELAGPNGTCLTLESEKLDVADCSEQMTVQLVIDPISCEYQVVSEEDHIFTDPGGSRYPQGITCLSHEGGVLGVAGCDAASGAQRFELAHVGEGVQLRRVGASDECVWVESEVATLGTCSSLAATLTLTEHAALLVDPTIDPTPIDVGHGNFWDTAGTELPLVQLKAVQGYRYFADDNYLEQTQSDAYIELELESSVTAPFLVHTNYATPFDGAQLAIYQDGEFKAEFEFLNSNAWRTVGVGPSFRLDLVAGERSLVRLESRNGLPHRFHRLVLTPPLPETDRLNTTTFIPAGGAVIAADAVHDVYRIGAVMEEETWWWRASWTHARVEYAVDMEVAGQYVLDVAYRAQPSDEPSLWGKRIVLDDNYETFQTIEVTGDSEGKLSATLSLTAGLHRILLEHPGHDVGEPMLGNVWTSQLELTPAP